MDNVCSLAGTPNGAKALADWEISTEDMSRVKQAAAEKQETERALNMANG